jgi:hypothetical protein
MQAPPLGQGRDSLNDLSACAGPSEADKPRHKLVSLGSLKEPPHESDLIRFWGTAFFRMRRHGLDEHQRRHVASEMVRKGARPPTGIVG